MININIINSNKLLIIQMLLIFVIGLLLPVSGQKNASAPLKNREKKILSGKSEADSVSKLNDSTTSKDTTKIKSSSINHDTVIYQADTIEYSIKKKLILMRGNSIVKYHTMTLYSDTIHFLLDQNILLATGKPQLIDGEDTVVGENMVYNIKTKRGRVIYGTAHSSDSRYLGNEIAMSDNKSFYIVDGGYTSCVRTDTMHYFFYGRNIKVIPHLF